MAGRPPELERRLKADTETVEELTLRMLVGEIRTPVFQRDLKWENKDVIDLLDSVYRGYPVGSLLFRRGAAEEARVRVGPFSIDAPDMPAALWVVDGQQRLTALTASLRRPDPMPTHPVDPWVVWFDARRTVFQAAPPSGDVPSDWVPVNWLGDTARLSEHVFRWHHAHDELLRRNLFEASRRLREYDLPMYVVETDDEDLLREIFYRINSAGKPLEWTEVHDALFGYTGSEPSTLGDLASELAAMQMGQPDEDLLLQALVGMRGLDVTRDLAEHYRREPSRLRDMVQEGLPTMRRVLGFVRRRAAVLHLRLLPRSMPIIVLARFFALHAAPNERSQELLARWVWRVLAGRATLNERTLARRSIAAIDADEEASVQRLLELAPSEPSPFVVPRAFDARAADSRVALLAMAALRPRHLGTGQELDVAALIEDLGVNVFRRIVAGGRGRARGAGNRIIQPGTGPARSGIEAHVTASGSDTMVLRSLAIPPRGVEALLAGDIDAFLGAREQAIADAVDDLVHRLAAWGRPDRPSIDYLLRTTKSEP